MSKSGLTVLLSFLLFVCCASVAGPRIHAAAAAAPHNIVVDTDIDTDDVLALIFLLKQNRSEINVKAVTINANSWASAAAAVNTVYDILYMLGREDVAVGVGGEGGISRDGTIQPDVGGYLPLIEQGEGTAGGCRYRQAVPAGSGGRMDIDTNFGLRRQLLPQSRNRGYVPGKQATAQQVLLRSLSSGTSTLLLLGGHTNIATLLWTHPEVKRHIDHIYVMGGAVHSSNPSGCCSADDAGCNSTPGCGTAGNIFDAVDSNPFSEFNMFMDPFAAYQVFHAGIPLTLVPLDATNTIPLSPTFFNELGSSKNQQTHEAVYVFETLKIVRDTWFDEDFFKSSFAWDSFASGVTVSGIRNKHDYTKNEFAEIVLKKVTAVTSNRPYGVDDGSNPFLADGRIPPFNITTGGIHSGHVQTGLRDPFCLAPTSDGRGVCQDGRTIETDEADGVNIFVAIKAKPNRDPSSPLDKQFFQSFITALNDPRQKAAFSFATEFKHYKEVFFAPDLEGKKLGKTVVFDMDMSAGDFVTLFLLLKFPVEVLNLTAITTVGNGWADSSAIDLVYDVLHMMGRDDIPVGNGAFFALNHTYPPFNAEGDCQYSQFIPQGAGGLIDSDTLYGLNRHLPRSPRRYTAQNSVKFGAPRDTEFPQLRQPSAVEVLSQVFSSHSKVTIITAGPLTNIATFLLSNASYKHQVEDIYMTSGSIYGKARKLDSVFSNPENKVAGFNFVLDPIAARYVLQSSGISKLNLIPHKASSKVPLTSKFVHKFRNQSRTPESKFVGKLLSTIFELRNKGEPYHFQSQHVLGEVLPPATLLDPSFWKEEAGTKLRYLEKLDKNTIFQDLLSTLNHEQQSAVVPSFQDQIKQWS